MHDSLTLPIKDNDLSKGDRTFYIEFKGFITLDSSDLSSAHTFVNDSFKKLGNATITTTKAFELKCNSKY